MKINKLFPLLFLLSPALIATATTDVEVKLKGAFDFRAGSISTNGPKKVSTAAGKRVDRISKNHKDFAFATTAFLGLEATNTLEDGFVYGAKLGIETTTKSSRAFQSCLFMEGDYGRLEMGSAKSPASSMRITPYSIAAGPGGDWDSWAKPDPTSEENRQVPYVTGFSNFLDQKLRSSGKVEYSRKVTYYTPEAYGLRMGLSYIPDTSNVGYAGVYDSSVQHSPVYSKYHFYVKNGIAAGLTYNKELTEDVKIKLSAVGETGKVVAEKKKNVVASVDHDFGYLKTYNIGAQLDYKNISFATSYADHLNSLTQKDELNKGTKIYGFSTRYKWEKISASIAYIASSHKNNKIKAVTIGTDYKMAPGLKPYAEVAYFLAKGKYMDPTAEKPPSHKGFVVVVGAKVEF